MKARAYVLPLLLAALAPPAFAQVPPMQSEFQVSQGTEYYQYAYGVSIDATGRFVVSWSGYAGADTSYDALARRYDAAGAPDGGEFQVDASAVDQKGGDVAKDASGNFVVVWQQTTTEVRGRRFQASGTPAGPSFPVSTTTLAVSEAHVASDASGNFAVVWSRSSGPTEFDVAARIFDSHGAPLTGEFAVNAYTTGQQHARGLAMDGGAIAFAWAGDGAGGPGVFARRYDAAGAPVTGDLDVNEGQIQFNPAEADVAMNGRSGFVVVWDGLIPPNGIGVFARRYDAAGAPISGEFPVNTTYTSGSQASSRVASDEAGNFIVSWTGQPLDGSASGIAARMFDRFGTSVSGDFIVNSSTTGYQYSSQVALTKTGTFVVAWNSPDNDYYGVFGRRSGVRSAAQIAVDTSISNRPSAVADNGVLEPGETVDVLTGWTNETAGALAMTGAASSFTGPAGATYTLDDAAADYGTVAGGATGSCADSGDCYAVTVSAPAVRPSQHWDTELQEALSLGVPKTWVLHVGESFPDVGTSNSFYRFIETLFHNRVTAGCAGGGYCPTSPVTRAQMAVFLLKSKFGSDHVPPPATGTVFTDVPVSNPFSPWIEELASLGITGGCGTGLYCPNDAVTRQQMAVFLLKALLGATYVPPPCAGDFADVPCPSQFANWIEDLYGRSITGGCAASPLLYCPTNPNNRGQMAVFLVKTFGLVLYGS